MAKGDKLAGAMSKGPSKSAMTRVSPGVYRSAEGKLVGSKGQALPQQNNMAMDMQRALQQIQPQQQGQSIPMPRGGQPMTADYRADRDGPIGTLPFAMPQMTPEQRNAMLQTVATGMNAPQQMPPMQPQQNNDQFYQTMRQSKDKGTLPLMARSQQQRLQQYQQNVAGGQSPQEAAQQQGLYGFGMKGRSPAEQQQAQQGMTQAQYRNIVPYRKF